MKSFRHLTDMLSEIAPLVHNSELDEALKEAERRKSATGEALAQLSAKIKAVVESKT